VCLLLLLQLKKLLLLPLLRPSRDLLSRLGWLALN
jgi:hypothetical protein